MNSSFNTSTRCSPREVIFGEKSTFRLPEVTGEQMRSSSPRSYGQNLRRIRERVHHLVSLSAEAADRQMELRLRRAQTPEELKVSDKVVIFRPQSAEAKRTKLPWIGPFTVCETNNRIVRISDSSGQKDWIHREDCRLVRSRRESLEISPIRTTVTRRFTDPEILPIRESQNFPPKLLQNHQRRRSSRKPHLYHLMYRRRSAIPRCDPRESQPEFVPLQPDTLTPTTAM